jgi:probable F420-dependent oxidoreductase
MQPLNELAFYTLAGAPSSPRALIDEVRADERMGLGSVFISERFNIKEAAALSGAVGAVSERLGIATGATNHNTRHPMVTASFATTMHRLTGGRFALGLGRGINMIFDMLGISRITTAEMEDFAGLMRRLWKGEMIFGHDGPAGNFQMLHLDPTFNEAVPLMITAFAPQTLRLAGRAFDGVILHTFFTDETVVRCVRTVREAAEHAGRDPRALRIWSCFATVGDHVPAPLRLKKTVGRLATYLQGYGPLLVKTNRWDAGVLERFWSDPVVGAISRRDRRQGDDRAARAHRRAAPRRVAGAGGDRFTAAMRRRRPAPVRSRRRRRNPARRHAGGARTDPRRVSPSPPCRPLRSSSR